ncbi:E3 ubiquitin-protein ligase TRIM71-like [Pecten maximus]|uniref:E3 ubiquitin-protein ligase TRIM71-like n=1 Tax=Pecten maximus TaxID=6579 RepID=UPI0014580662|nr:E3 ubiquitin-protein ligase TRIM71-like [Pecten maximus]
MVPITKDLTVNSSKTTCCQHHKMEEIKFFCENCKYGICVKCLLGDHGEHIVTDMTVTLNSKRNELKHCIKHIHDQIWILQDILFNLTCLEGRIKGKYEETKLQMKKSSRKLVNKIFGAEVKLLCELDEAYQRQSDDVYRRKQQCKTHLEQFKSLQSRLDGILKVEDIDNVLENYTDILSEVHEINITKQYKSKFLKSPESLEFVPNGSVSIGKLSLVPNDMQGRQRASSRHRLITRSTSGQVKQQTGKSSSGPGITPRVASSTSHGHQFGRSRNPLHKSQPILFDQRSEDSNSPDLPPVTNTYDPQRYCDEASSNSECVPAVKLVYKVNTSGAGRGQLSLPFSATFDKEGRLLVAENGNGRLQMFGNYGHTVKIIGLPSCVPRCVTTTADGKAYALTDEESKCVKLVSEDGILMKEIYIAGDAFPFGITTLDDDQFAISDIIYECVSIISANGEKDIRFGSHGNTSAKLENPSYLTTNLYGNILVSDSGHHEVKVFDRLGNYLYKFGGYGTAGGQLRYPKGIACDKNGLVYVADSGNDRVVVFSEVGLYCGMLLGRVNGIKRPTGLAYSPKGLMAITMPDDDEVSVYELTSSIPRSFTQ